MTSYSLSKGTVYRERGRGGLHTERGVVVGVQSKYYTF